MGVYFEIWKNPFQVFAQISSTGTASGSWTHEVPEKTTRVCFLVWPWWPISGPEKGFLKNWPLYPGTGNLWILKNGHFFEIWKYIFQVFAQSYLQVHFRRAEAWRPRRNDTRMYAFLVWPHLPILCPEKGFLQLCDDTQRRKSVQSYHSK